MKGAPPQIEVDIKRVQFPTWDLSVTERVRYSDIQIVRYPAFDRAKERCAIANAIAEDTEFFTLLEAAVTVGPNVNLTASSLTRSILADAFGTILKNQLTVGAVILNPWDAKDILKWTSSDLDQVTLYNVTTQGLLGSIWNAKFLVSTKVPQNKIYVVTTPEKLGVLPERKPIEVKVFDNSPGLEFLMTAWSHIGNHKNPIADVKFGYIGESLVRDNTEERLILDMRIRRDCTPEKIVSEVVCLVCAKKFKQITSSHLKYCHDMTMKEYCDSFGIETQDLCSVSTRSKKSEAKIGNDFGKFKRNGSYVNCVICGKEVYVAPHQVYTKYCSRKCQHKGLIGQLAREKHPRWKGGEKYYPPEFFQIREDVKARDDYKCAICGSERNCCAHHIDHNPENNILFNLLTLCGSCHAKENTKMYKKEFRQMIFKIQSELHSDVQRVAEMTTPDSFRVW